MGWCFLKFFYFSSVLWGNFINICSTFTHSFAQFFVYLGEVCVEQCAFLEAVWKYQAGGHPQLNKMSVLTLMQAPAVAVLRQSL